MEQRPIFSGVETENVLLNQDITDAGHYNRNQFLLRYRQEVTSRFRNGRFLTASYPHLVKSLESDPPTQASWIFIQDDEPVGVIEYVPGSDGVRFRLLVEDSKNIEGSRGQIISVMGDKVVTDFTIDNGAFRFLDHYTGEEMQNIIDQITTGDYIFAAVTQRAQEVVARVNQPKRSLNLLFGEEYTLPDTIEKTALFDSLTDFFNRVRALEKFRDTLDEDFRQKVDNEESNPIDRYIAEIMTREETRTGRKFTNNREALDNIFRYLIVEVAPPLKNIELGWSDIYHSAEPELKAQIVNNNSVVFRKIDSNSNPATFGWIFSTVIQAWALYYRKSSNNWLPILPNGTVSQVALFTSPLNLDDTSIERDRVDLQPTQNAFDNPEQYFYRITYGIGNDKYQIRHLESLEQWWTVTSDGLISFQNNPVSLFLVE